MFKRIVLFIFISLALALALAGPAAADAPISVYCPIWWTDPSGVEWFEIPGEGELVINGQGFNLTCNAQIDFSNPANASLEEMCAVYGCKGAGENMLFQNSWYWGEFLGEFIVTIDAKLLVHPDGRAFLKAQYSPEQCGSEMRGFSYTLGFPAGYWGLGNHTYTIHWIDPRGEEPYEEINIQTFTVDSNAPLLHESVRLGGYGQIPVNVINPEQQTYMQFTYFSGAQFDQELQSARASFTIDFSWDGGDLMVIEPGPLRNFCAEFGQGRWYRSWGWVK